MIRLLVSSVGIATAHLVLLGCQSGAVDRRKVVEFQYDHVANIQSTIRFATPVPLSPPVTSTRQVITKWPNEFWAIFVICSLDVQGPDLESFTYDRTNFYVEYERKSYGVLQQPFSVITETEDEIGPQDTSAIQSAIFTTIGVGPSTQIFSHGLSLSLNYRIAIYISDPEAANKVLPLRYTGHPAILRGRGHPPTSFPGYTPDSPPLPGTCRPS